MRYGLESITTRGIVVRDFLEKHPDVDLSKFNFLERTGVVRRRLDKMPGEENVSNKKRYCVKTRHSKRTSPETGQLYLVL